VAHEELTPRYVLFDAVGTVLLPDPPVAEAYQAVGHRFGSRLSTAEVLPRFRAAFARQESLDRGENGQRTSEDRERERWRSIVFEVFADVADREPLFDALWQHFAEPRHWRVTEGAGELLHDLAARNFVLGLASNFDRRLELLVQGLELLVPCRHIFASSALGSRKPAIEFFRAIERELNAQPRELLLVGDDFENDFLAARHAGWHAVLYDPENRYDAEPRIKRLSDLSLASAR
jgi:putative hydrolase of the HAD superfamily